MSGLQSRIWIDFFCSLPFIPFPILFHCLPACLHPCLQYQILKTIGGLEQPVGSGGRRGGGREKEGGGRKGRDGRREEDRSTWSESILRACCAIAAAVRCPCCRHASRQDVHNDEGSRIWNWQQRSGAQAGRAPDLVVDRLFLVCAEELDSREALVSPHAR
eukprot:3924898-Rhodomonas_salina.3